MQDKNLHTDARAELESVAEAMNLAVADVAGQASAQKVSAKLHGTNCSESRPDHSYAQLAAGLNDLEGPDAVGKG